MHFIAKARFKRATLSCDSSLNIVNTLIFKSIHYMFFSFNLLYDDKNLHGYNMFVIKNGMHKLFRNIIMKEFIRLTVLVVWQC